MTTPVSARATPFALVIVAELLAGIALGAVLGAGLGIGIGSIRPITQQLGMGTLLLMLYVAVFGFGIGAAIGIWLVGRRLHQRGSLGLALTAAPISTVLVITLIQFVGFGSNAPVVFIVIAIIPLVLALLGYNLRRGAA